MAAERNLVVLGAGPGGLGAAHYLLRHTIPAVKAASAEPATYKVILIASTSQIYWNVAAPRLLVSEKLIPTEKAFLPIADGFTSYPKESFQFIHGSVVKLDPDARTVSVELADSTEQAVVPYHALVIATGASNDNPMWGVTQGHDKTRAALRGMHEKLPQAETVLIAGGGPTGVETAGEIAAEYGKSKQITLLSGGSKLLQAAKTAISQPAESMLTGMGVTVRHNVRVQSSNENSSDGKTTLQLSDGSSATVDIYIDATGLKPNTAFIPPALLDASTGKLATDPHTLRVPAAGPRVYGLGSVASYSSGGIMDVWNATAPLMANVEHDLSDGKAGGGERAYKKMDKEMVIIPIGRKGGVGALFGWRIPSRLVWLIKGRNYFIDQIKDTRDGTKYLKKS